MEKSITLKVKLQADSSALAAEIDKTLKARRLDLQMVGSGVSGSTLRQQPITADFRSAIQSIPLERQVDRIVKAIEDSRPSKLGAIAGGAARVAGAVGGAVLSPATAIARGALEGFGRDLNRDLSKGISDALAGKTDQYIGSGKLLGTKLVDVLADGLNKGIQDAISKGLGIKPEQFFDTIGGGALSQLLTGEKLNPKELINRLLGDQQVARESLQRQGRARAEGETQTSAATEEARKQRAELIRQRFQRSENLAAIEKQSKDEGTELAKLRIALGRVNNPKLANNIISRIDELVDNQIKLEKEYQAINKQLVEDKKKVKDLEKLIADFKPEIPIAYQQAFESVAGKGKLGKMPELVPAEDILAKQGFNAAYDPASNSILVRQELLEAVQANNLSANQLRTLLEELSHAVQFGFGSARGEQFSRANQTLTSVSQPTPDDRKRYAEILEQYAPEQRQYELEAKVRAEREAARLFDTRQRQDKLQRLEGVVGVAGSKLQGKLFGPQIKEAQQDLAELREVINRFALTDLDPQAIARLEELKTEMTRIFGSLVEFTKSVPKAQDSNADEIEALMASIGKDFQALQQLRERISQMGESMLPLAEMQARWQGIEPTPDQMGPIIPSTGGREIPDPWADPTAIQKVEQALNSMVGQGTIANKVFGTVATELGAVSQELGKLLRLAWGPLLSIPEQDRALLRKYLNQQAMRAGQFTGKLANTALQGAGDAYNLASDLEKRAFKMLGPVAPIAKAGLQAGVIAPGAFMAASQFPVVGAGLQAAQGGIQHLLGSGAAGLGGQLGTGAADLISQATAGVPLIQGAGAKLATQLPTALSGLTGAAGEAIGGYVGAVLTGLGAMAGTHKLVEEGAKKVSEALPEPIKIPLKLPETKKVALPAAGHPQLPPKVRSAAEQTVTVAVQAVEDEVIESLAQTRKAIQGMDVEAAKGKANEIKENIQKAHRLFRETLEQGNAELAMGYAKALGKITQEARAQIDELLKQAKDSGVNFGELPSLLGGIKGNLTNQLKKSRQLAQAPDDDNLKASIDLNRIRGKGLSKELLDQINKTLESFENASDRFDAAEKKISEKLGEREKRAADNLEALSKKIDGTGAAVDKIGPRFGKFNGFLKELSFNLLGLLGAYSVADILVNIGRASVGTALNFRQLSASVPTDKLKALKAEADEVGALFRVAADGYKNFYNATKRGALSGQADKIFEGFLQGATAAQAGPQEYESIFRAITQMASKGRISLEELTGQLEALPDALGVAARSMGVLPEQMIKMVESGDVLASQLLPRMANQLALESGVSLAAASETATAKLNRLQNSMFELQTTVGGGFLDAALPAIDAANGGLKFLAENANLLSAAIKFLGFTAIAQLITRSGALATQLGALTLIKKLAGIEAINLASATTLAGRAAIIAGVGFKALGGIIALTVKALAIPAALATGWELFNASVNAGLEQTKKSTAAVTGLTNALADAYDNAADKAARLNRNRPKRESSNPFARFADDFVIDPFNRAERAADRFLNPNRARLRQSRPAQLTRFGDYEFQEANRIRQERINEGIRITGEVTARTPKNLEGIRAESEALDKQLATLRAQRDMYRRQGKDLKDIELQIKQVETAHQKANEPVAVNLALLSRTKTTFETLRTELLEQSNLTDEQQREYANGSEAVRAALLSQSGLTEQQLGQLKQINQVLSITEQKINAINAVTRKANEERLKFVNALKDIGFKQQNTDFQREDLELQRKLNISEQRSAGGLEFTQQRQTLDLERRTQTERLKQLKTFRDEYEKILKGMAVDQRNSLEIFLGKKLESSLPGDIARVRAMAEANQITLTNAQEQALATQEKILGIERQGWEARITLAENALARRQAIEDRANQRQLAALDRQASRLESVSNLFDKFVGVGQAAVELGTGRAERMTKALDRAKSTLEAIVGIDKEIADRAAEADKELAQKRRERILSSYDAAGDTAGRAAFEASFAAEDQVIAEREAELKRRSEQKSARDIGAKREALRLNLIEQFGARDAEQLITDPELALQALLAKRQEIERAMLNYKEEAANRELNLERLKLGIDLQREQIAQRRAKLEADREARDAGRALRAANTELASAQQSGDKERIANAQLGVQEATQAVGDAKARQDAEAFNADVVRRGFGALLEQLGLKQQNQQEQFAMDRREQRFDQRLALGEAGINPGNPRFNHDAFHQRQVDRALANAAPGAIGPEIRGLVPTNLPTPQLPQMPDPAIFTGQLEALRQITSNLGILPQFLGYLQSISAASAATAAKPPVVVNAAATAGGTAGSMASEARRR